MSYVDVCDAQYLYVYVVKEKEMGVCQVWQLILCEYKKDKGRSKGLIKG